MPIYVIALSVVASISLVVYALWPSKDEEGNTIKRRMAGRSVESSTESIREKAKQSVAQKVAEKVAPIAVRSSQQTAEEMSKLRRKLESAGFRNERAALTFLASKTIVAVGLGVAVHVKITKA